MLLLFFGCNKQNNPAAGIDPDPGVDFYTDQQAYPSTADQNGVHYELAIVPDTINVSQTLSAAYSITNNSSDTVILTSTKLNHVLFTVRKADGTLVVKGPKNNSDQNSAQQVSPGVLVGIPLFVSMSDNNGSPIPAGSYQLRAKLDVSPEQPVLMKSFAIK